MLGNNRIKQLRALNQKKFRLEEQLFLAEGAKIVLELIGSDFPVTDVFALPPWIHAHSGLLNKFNGLVHEVNDRELDQISSLTTPQDVIACCRIPETKLPEIIPGKLFLLLDSIRDPGNMGTLIRLADWFGIDGIIASEDSVEWTNPKVIQATMGSFIRIRPAYVNMETRLSEINPEIPVYAADLGGENLYSSGFRPEGILIISNEAHGLTTGLSEFINKKLRIPRFSAQSDTGAESLNAAMAAAIMLGEFARRRLGKL